MDLPLDIFGFASVLLSGFTRTAQCLTLGSIAFLAVIAVPLSRSAAVRNQVMRNGRAKYVFPLLCALGGVLLMTHSHSIANVKELLLIEMTNMPLAVFAIWSGWTRWLELRLDGRAQVIAGWLWPTFFCLTAVTLLLYREI
jgi:putative copper resistance protein D